MPSWYQMVPPVTMVPIDSVTTNGLRRRTATRTPFTKPTPAARSSEMKMAPPRRTSEPWEMPTVVMLAMVMTEGTDRSMPPVITTITSPMAAIARIAAKGRMSESDVVP